jgi:hypothetical protein
MRARVLGGILALGLAISGCAGDDAFPDRESLTTCEDGRPTTFHALHDLEGADRVVADADAGFLLFRRRSFEGGMVYVGPDGRGAEEHSNPLSAATYLGDAAFFGGGGAMLAGVEFSDSTNGWMGRVGSHFELEWELPVELELMNIAVQVLPDEGAIVAGTLRAERVDGNELAGHDLFWSRVDAAGKISWERRAQVSFEARPWGPLTFAVGADSVRFVVETRAGLVLISSDLDGNDVQHRMLETRLALHLVAVVALPSGELVIVTNRTTNQYLAAGVVLTIVDAAGNVLSERHVGKEERAQAKGVRFNPVRGEIIIFGSDDWESRTWLRAANIEGELTWSLRREPLQRGGPNNDYDHVTVEPDRGPELADVAVAPDGSLLAVGSAMQLCYFVVGSGDCR